MTTAEKIKVMQAFLDGKTIQLKSECGKWEDWNRNVCGEPYWTWGAEDQNYRIKPEPMEIEVWVKGMGPVVPINSAYSEPEFVMQQKGWTKKRFREVV